MLYWPRIPEPGELGEPGEPDELGEPGELGEPSEPRTSVLKTELFVLGKNFCTENRTFCTRQAFLY